MLNPYILSFNYKGKRTPIKGYATNATPLLFPPAIAGGKETPIKD